MKNGIAFQVGAHVGTTASICLLPTSLPTTQRHQVEAATEAVHHRNNNVGYYGALLSGGALTSLSPIDVHTPCNSLAPASRPPAWIDIDATTNDGRRI